VFSRQADRLSHAASMRLLRAGGGRAVARLSGKTILQRVISVSIVFACRRLILDRDATRTSDFYRRHWEVSQTPRCGRDHARIITGTTVGIPGVS